MSGRRIATEQDLARCADEPIHIPGAIQPHGLLIALDEATLRVVQVSANIDRFLPVSAEETLGRSLPEVLGEDGAAKLEQALRRFHLQEVNPLPLTLGAAAVDGIVHRQPGLVVLEIEPRMAATDQRDALLGRAVARLQAAASLEEVQDATVHRIRDLTGYDRVMVYRFSPEGHGSVVAESLAAGLDPYLGLHYPASDIPQQARQLYLRNWLRIIPNADYEPVPLVPALRPDTGEPLDLSLAALRSVSPVHREYLINFGARASMSISLRSGDRLWGLISCINRSPRHVPFALRQACETIGQLVSLQIRAFEEIDERQARDGRAYVLDELRSAMHEGAGELPEALAARPQALLQATAAGGCAVLDGGAVRTFGYCPPVPEIRALGSWVAGRTGDHGSFHSRHLAAEFPAAAAYADRASGLLAVRLPRPDAMLLWFRPEEVQIVSWGGDPRQKASVEEESLRLHPRHSFEQWKEEVRQHAVRWTKTDIDAAHELRRSAVEADLARRLDS